MFSAFRRRSNMKMSYQVAGIDVHKKMLAVVVTDAAQEGAFTFERRKFGAMDGELRVLTAWLAEQGGERSSDGIDGAVREAGVAATGTAIPAALGAGAIQSRSAGPPARFRGCRAAGAAAYFPGGGFAL